MSLRIAVVGGGVSGCLTAVHLMRRAARDDLRIRLFNRSGRLARGLAYGTRSDDHVLNVPAARMSAFADDPGHFLRHAQAVDPTVQPGSFVPRRLYGDYLEQLMRSEQARMPEPARFEHVDAAVHDIALHGDEAQLVAADGTTWAADRVALAFGHFAPADPEVPGGLELAASARYVRDPWSPDALARVPPGQPVLLLGTGLTMVDMALALHARGCRRLHALSRRGLLPQAHREHAAPPIGLALPAELEAGTPLLRGWLALIRARCREQAAIGIDWRETLATLRQATPALWQRLDARQQRQFLRHVQAHWEVHRHRLAPQPARRLQALLDDGTLRLHAGRLLSIEHREEGLRLRYRARGGLAEHAVEAGMMINCTGPTTRLSSVREPLLQALLARGEMTADPLGLGIAVDGDLAMLRSDGCASPVLHYIGPFLRARYWECTAVPELRMHAERLAGLLCDSPPISLAA